MKSGWHVYYEAMVQRDAARAQLVTLGDVMLAYERRFRRAFAQAAAAWEKALRPLAELAAELERKADQ